MKKKNYTAIYLILTLLLISSAGLLGMQVKHYKYQRETEPTKELRVKLKNVALEQEGYEKEREAEKKSSRLVFSQTKSFKALATPRPTPTQRPRALPTPTPATPGKKWTVDMITKKIGMIYDYKNTFFTVRVGDVMKDPAFGDFKVLELLPPTPAEMMSDSRGRVRIQHIKTGTVTEISQAYKKKNIKKTIRKK